jgi:hypothetical protein
VIVRAFRLGVLVALLLLPAVADAQFARDSSVDWLVSAGSEGERYLRTLQVAGLSPATQWSIRPFSNAALARIAPVDSGHPWASRFRARPASRLWIRPVAPEVWGIFNSTFPYGMNDGPVWAGRGLTVVASAGVQGEVGPLEFVIAPQFFRAQNAGFPLAPNGLTGLRAFADARSPYYIDLPQRFGDSPYQRIDPGQSTVSLNALHLTVGASTANEFWGPAIESPFLLGNNAAGFAHLFAGTDGPLSLGPVILGLRVIAGRLEQTDYSPAPYSARRRSLAGITAVLGVRQLPGLEIGVGRMFESIYPDSGVSLGEILRPLVEGILKTQRARELGNGTGDDTANQLASLFARWAFPSAGVELYGEVGREDHSVDLRDLIEEPDHDLMFMVGLQRVWRRPAGALLSVRGELMNSQISHLNIVRPQAPPYVHFIETQGHTQLGQLLGAPGGYGGGASSLALDLLDATGRKTLSWQRIVREPGTSAVAKKDVMHALTADWVVFRPRIDVKPEVALIYGLNRNGSTDKLNFRLAMSGTAHW